MILRSLVPILLLGLLDLYFFQAIRTLTSGSPDRIRFIIQTLFWISSFSVYAMVIASVDPQNLTSGLRSIFLSFILISVVSKLSGILALSIEDIARLIGYAGRSITEDEASIASRRGFVSTISLALFTLPFATLAYGMMAKVSRMSTKRIDLKIPKLPDGWDGAVIAQISDLHVGSLSSPELIEKAAQIIADENPDLTVFTGDLVNAVASEAEPFIESLSKIKGKLGQFSILGNHDYGIYHQWDDSESKKKNEQLIQQIHAQSGFDLLRNENRRLERNGDYISLLGCENWSASQHFPKFGDLNKTMAGVPEKDVKVLLSHDPTHWDAEVVAKTDIALTLSGHTHGFQFGMDIPGFVKWSPVQYVYKRWSGMYKEAGQFLYVNRGLGFLGYMGRVGMTPEVTFITLRRQSA